MRRPALAALFAALLAAPAAAQDVGAALRARDWTRAASLATDPLAVRLVTWYRLQAPGQASAAEISAFVATQRDWPWLAQLERRRQEALAQESDPAILAAECARATLHHAPALGRCAEAARKAGNIEAAQVFARRAWTTDDGTDPRAEAAFLQRWSAALRPEDHWARFTALLPQSVVAATRMLPWIPADRKPLAAALLGFRQNAPNQAALLAAVPKAHRNDPLLFLAEARDLREKEEFGRALDLWRDRGVAAQQGLSGDALEPFWTERHLFARRRLRDGDPEGAYLLTAGHGNLRPERRVDAQFLAGFIALRFLKDPARAEVHFRDLAETSRAAITQGRAHYWLGRTAAAAGGDAGAHFRRAAAWPLTFYGQLAAAELGESSVEIANRIRALADPSSPHREPEHELVRAATLLASWGERKQAFAFLLRMDELTPEAADRARLARLALRLGLPEAATAIGRRMGRDGLMLPEAGWPLAAEPPGKPIPVAVSLALIRQESAFEASAVSRVGARGLMQLMPATAQAVARRLGEPTSPAALLSDPAHNMRLGTAYLAQLHEQFGSLPLALAAYNAGPHRVTAWLAANGDPRDGRVDLIDWIELIPFNETRNYVQRVLENIAIYRVRRGEAEETLLAEWRK
jgi:soluble lytic murein transglycosylase